MKKTLLCILMLFCGFLFASAEQEPIVSFKCETMHQITLRMVASPPGSITIDPGNGVTSTQFITSGFNTVNITPAGTQEVKIYSDEAVLTMLTVSSAQLSEIDLSKLTALTELTVILNPLLTSLDISKNTALKTLTCNDNGLTTLDVTKNTALTKIFAPNNQLTSLVFGANTALATLDCYGNLLPSLDVSSLTALSRFNCSSNRLAALDLSKNTNLTEVNCSNNNFKFSTLPIKKSNWNTYTFFPQNAVEIEKEVSEVDLSSEKLVNAVATTYSWKTKAGTNLVENSDFSISEGITTFLRNQNDSVYCQMENTAFPGLALITSLTKVAEIAQEDPIATFQTSADIDKEFTLRTMAKTGGVIKIDNGDGVLQDYTVETSNTKLTITVKGSTIKIYDPNDIKLTMFSLSDASITSIDVSNLTELFFLSVYGNLLTSLDVSKNLKLEELNCSNNQLTELDITNNTELTVLYVQQNEFADIDISKNTKLTMFYCFSNKLTGLDVSKHTALKELRCGDNAFGSIDVSQNANLSLLDCSKTGIASLDISKNENLTYINCSDNMLSELDFSNNPKLSQIHCAGNFLKFSTLPLKQAAWTNYAYAPQANIAIAVTTNQTVDLSSEAVVNEVPSTYKWITKEGIELVEGTDYSVRGGVTSFYTAQSDSVYCELSNTQFPLFTATNKSLKTSMTYIETLAGISDTKVTFGKVYAQNGVIVIDSQYASLAKVYDASGRQVTDAQLENGPNEIAVHSGIFVVELIANEGTSTHKVIVK
ncbi:hypothetical protein M2132_002033 [Dysgonomonas sp. PH5-45]|uniref:T9SS type A sorting domain-containing protein n=1 Tax=unclassified Dysgonomonas TaxID=2630389 RepID=UPI0024751610|nr:MULTISPECIES: T9SS type A sorting domain-containing protein [unclassified Dysgonomonas]MDH6355687.1 hypothetical protein [Dysgonomonas sp. PH5-45]MDH6388584.1 hypothetical protein [Dysgonomonas sp. PH5-37]